MRQGTLGILPYDANDLGPVPLCFRQRLLIGTALGHVPGLLQQRLHLWLVVWLLDRQNRQAVEGHADQRELTLVLRIGEQFFIGLLGLFPGVLEGMGLPQMGIEAFDLRGRKLGLYPLWLLQQGARLLVVPDGLLDGKDGQRLIPGLHAGARGGLGLSGQQRVIGQLGGPRSFAVQ